MYMARQLSFAGVTFDIKEVPLSDQFIEMYNASAVLVCTMCTSVLNEIITSNLHKGNVNRSTETIDLKCA